MLQCGSCDKINKSYKINQLIAQAVILIMVVIKETWWPKVPAYSITELAFNSSQLQLNRRVVNCIFDCCQLVITQFKLMF